MRARTVVVVGIVTDDRGRVLINQRTFPDRYQGKWEFPGGKIESAETPERALYRELQEELGIEIIDSEPLITINHDYPDRNVMLLVYKVLGYLGEAYGAEGQAIRWVSLDALVDVDFLEANHPVISAARLPDLYLITDTQRYGLSHTCGRIRELASDNAKFMVQIREKHVNGVELHKIATPIKECCRDQGVKVVGNMSIDDVRILGLDGIHMNAIELRATTTRPFDREMLVGVSCHNQDELRKAELIDADFALLSPVQQTVSHPNASVLGWNGLELLIQSARLPVYGLGGLDRDDLGRAKYVGARGVAMISGAWSRN